MHLVSPRRLRRSVFALALTLCSLAPLAAHAGVLATGTLDRIYEPVVVPGATLSALLGSPPGELWAYAYRSGAWVQIPVQVDQKNSQGKFFGAEVAALEKES